MLPIFISNFRLGSLMWRDKDISMYLNDRVEWEEAARTHKRWIISKNMIIIINLLHYYSVNLFGRNAKRKQTVMKEKGQRVADNKANKVYWFDIISKVAVWWYFPWLDEACPIIEKVKSGTSFRYQNIQVTDSFFIAVMLA